MSEDLPSPLVSYQGLSSHLWRKKKYTIPPGLTRGVKVPLGDCQSTRSWQSFSHWTTSIHPPT
uniref:Uncharacterized protein n=1 Tax=Aegilops tauschii subsp. strangulata TaxID=200361 RepID=A0A453NI18_AEGTS